MLLYQQNIHILQQSIKLNRAYIKFITHSQNHYDGQICSLNQYKFQSIPYIRMLDQQPKIASNTNIPFERNMKICSEIYTLTQKIGSGNFGEVFLALKNQTAPIKGNKIVGVKIERERPGVSPHLPNQISILKSLKEDPESIGFPQIYESGIQKHSHYLVMELLGPNLGDLLKLCGGKFTLGTTLFLAMQIFERIQFFHSKGYVYRDIKPQNFLMGIGAKSSILYMIDFGLSRTFKDPRINLHKPYRQEREFSGNLRYASICSHLRIQHSRRDDLESICYMLIYFLLGTLPWQSKRQQNLDMKQRLIVDKKLKISTTELCAEIPIEFRNILECCQNLDYYEDPDYQYIQGQLNELYEKIFSRQIFVYDWAKLEEENIIFKDQYVIKISPFDEKNKSNYRQFHQLAAQNKQRSQIKWIDQNQNEKDEKFDSQISIH